MAVEELKQIFKAVKNCPEASTEKGKLQHFWYEVSTVFVPKLDENHTKK